MIRELSERIKASGNDLKKWHQSVFERALPPPVYGSVDIRNAGFKVSVVDTNLFPAGFNNLCETFSKNASQAFQTYFRHWYPSVQKILIFPEEHTRNLYYWKNIAALKSLLEQAGLEVRIGSTSTQWTSDPFIIPVEEISLSIQKLFLKNTLLQTSDFVPDAILINNDFSSGVPDYFSGLRQIVLPSPHLGWHRRRKSEHFELYNDLVQEAASILKVDPWFLSPMTTMETGIDLTDEICLKRMQETADETLSHIRQKYLQYGIPRQPYLFVKNNSGTYGLGITHIQSGKELLEMNRKLRNKLEYAKGGRAVSEYLFQEGIPTADLYRGKPLEPVVYAVGGEVAGTFFRINEEKNELDNLNTPGMQFACLCFHKVQNRQNHQNQKTYQLTYENKDQLFSVTSFLTQVAMMAAMQEMKKAEKPLAESA